MSEATPEAPQTPTPNTPTPTPPAPTEPAPSEPATPKSFTQDEVNAMLAKQKREQFGDYGDLKAQAARLAEIEESQKTEQERAAEAARKAQQDAADARAEALRYKAAATHGISEDYFDLLGSGDEEAVNNRAERIGALVKTASEIEQLRAEVEALRTGKPVPTSSRPIESLRPGATPTSPQNEDDVLYNSLFGG
jgi:multidrug efflux pump subunit AcrA (membrane-fusion protein)